VKDWSRSFWSAVLQHRFRFHRRDDFHLVQSRVHAEPRIPAGSDPASPSNAGFTALQSSACRHNTNSERCQSRRQKAAPYIFPWRVCFAKKRSKSGRAGSPLPAECFSGVWIAARPAHAGRALPYSLRICCEGLEEKFLERGAPAPLSVRLIHDLRVSQSLVQAGPRWGSWLGRSVAFQRGICCAVRTAFLRR